MRTFQSAPVDHGGVVGVIFFILGLGTLLPWNFFVTATKYFNNRLNDSEWVNGTLVSGNEYSFNNWMTLLSQLPLLLFSFLNSFLYQRMSEKVRIAGSFIFILLLFILTAVLVTVGMEKDSFFSITMVTIWFISSFGAVLQGSLFGLVGLLPQKYGVLFMSGQGMAGTFAALAMIITTYTKVDDESAALAYFITPCAGTLVALVGFMLLPRFEFAQHYFDKRKTYDVESKAVLLVKVTTLDTESTGNGKLNGHANGSVPEGNGKLNGHANGSVPEGNGKLNGHANGSVPEGNGKLNSHANGSVPEGNGKLNSHANGSVSEGNGKLNGHANGSVPEGNGKLNSHANKNGHVMKQGYRSSEEPEGQEGKLSVVQVLKKIWVMAFCVTFVFTVTLSVFPVVTVDVQTVYGGKWELYFISVCCFLTFNVMDFIGRTVTSVCWPSKESRLFPALVLTRLIFIPLLMSCNVQGRSYWPVLFSNDFAFMFIMILLSVTNGYFACLSMTYAPQLVKPKDAETAGALMMFFLALGLSLGAALSFPIRALI